MRVTVRGRVAVAALALVAAGLGAGPVGAAGAPARPDEGPQTLPFTGIDAPADVAVDANGTTYVADTGHDRIVKLTAGGTQSTVGFTGLADPTGVAVDGVGNVFVADTTNDRIVKLPANGGAQVVLGFTGLDAPSDVVVDDEGTVFVSDTGHDRVVKLLASGAQLTMAFTGIGGAGPGGIAVDRVRNVYAVDGTNHRVLRLAPGDTQTTVDFGFLSGPRSVATDGAGTVYVSDVNAVFGLPAGGSTFAVPFVNLGGAAGIAIDDRGTTYVADTPKDRVLALPSGAGVPGELGFTGLNQPADVAADANGNVFVSDTYNDRVLMLPAGGGPQVTVASTGLHLPRGLAVDGAGGVYVADSLNDRIVRIPPGGGTPVLVPFTGLSTPTGVAVDAAGNVYVADHLNNRVVKRLASNGTQSVVPFVGLTGQWDVAVDVAGNVFVSATSSGGTRMLPAGGGAQVALDDTGLGVYGLAVDRSGDLLVASPGNGLVAQLPLSGGGWSPLGFSGLAGPLGVAAGPTGTVYVADTNANRVVALVRTPPQLRATTSPALPAEISVDGTPRDAWGLNWADVGIGDHLVCFGPVLGYVAPPCQGVELSVGTTATVTGTYSQNGYLRAITSPAVPSTISVDGVPRNDWGLWAEISPGNHQVCFGAVAGSDAPACRTVLVPAGATATTTGTFTPNGSAPGPGSGTGFLRATTSPATAAMISVDGQWRNNWGLDWVRLPVGSHEVCFGPAPAATTPPCQTVNVTEGATSTVTGTYATKGFLRVQTSPALPASIRVDGIVANAYGMWAPRAPGTYQVCFGAVPGYATPACQSATVAAGGTTTITGTFAPT